MWYNPRERICIYQRSRTIPNAISHQNAINFFRSITTQRQGNAMSNGMVLGPHSTDARIGANGNRTSEQEKRKIFHMHIMFSKLINFMVFDIFPPMLFCSISSSRSWGDTNLRRKDKYSHSLHTYIRFRLFVLLIHFLRSSFVPVEFQHFPQRVFHVVVVASVFFFFEFLCFRQSFMC